MLIKDIFNVGNGGDNFGVEIELENITHRPVLDGWRDEPDGSLRHLGREFVFTKPRCLAKSKDALERLEKAFEDNNVKPLASNLTSTHIHVDVRHLNIEQFQNFLALLFMFEPLIAANSGEDRQFNYFALPTSCSDHRLRELSKMSSEGDLKRTVALLRGRDLRYCGINLNPLSNYGSIEIRYLSGQSKPTDVYPWLQFYNRLRDVSKSFVDFDELFEIVSRKDMKAIEDEFSMPFKADQELLLEGVRNSQDFVFRVNVDFIDAPENGNGLADYIHNL